jgi:hypothetical protein
VSSASVSVADLEALHIQLDWTAVDCRAQVTAFRKTVDSAFDSTHISVKQWRGLLTQVSEIQEKCLGRDPNE